MSKSKRTVSVLAAVAVAATAFTSLTLTASAAVSSVTVNYVNGSNIVASKTVDISSQNLDVGAEYTYISTAYVKGIDGKIYAATNIDYTSDSADSVVLDNRNGGKANQNLKQTVTLTDSTIIKYDVTESPNAIFYSEWEDLVNGNQWSFDQLYTASGGTMSGTTNKVSFYDITESGYYQILLVGRSNGRGTAIYETAEAAAAATAVDDGSAILKIKANNSIYYGYYSAKKLYLTAGDKLTIRGFATNGSTDDIDYVVIRRIVSGDVIGADGVSIIPGGQTSAFSFDSGTDVTPTWSVSGVSGVSIDQNGVLTAAADATEGTVTVKAEIESAGLSGIKNVTIAKAAIDDFTFNAPAVVSKGSSVSYSISGVKDQFGKDITAAATAVYSSSNSGVVSIDASTGAATPVKDGTATITVKVSVGDANKTKTQDVTVKSLYLTGTTPAVDSSSLVTSGNVTGYRITTAKDGAIVKQYDAAAIPSTVDMTDADSWEIDPIYTYNIPSANKASYTAPDIFADGYYNTTFTKGDARRADINVNGYMVGNNVDQYGWGRSNSAGTEYSINDVVVSGGSIALTLSDNQSASGLTKAVIVKAPSNVARKHKVYVIGDSLVANYYGTYTSEVGTARTGWGQQLSNFVSNDWEVVNFANSGNYAEGLQKDAHPGIMAMIQPGDWYVIESGYNDRTYSTRDKMHEAVKEMTEEAAAKGAHVALVSPNASAHDFKPDLQFGSEMGKVYEELKAAYGSELTYIDLSKLSYDFMVGTGISTQYKNGGTLVQVNFDGERFVSAETSQVVQNGFVPAANITADKCFVWDAISGDTALNRAEASSSTEQVILTYNNNTALTHDDEDTLHSSYAAAMKWAEIVAQGMKDAGAGFINTDFSYTFTDTIGNNITCQVK